MELSKVSGRFSPQERDAAVPAAAGWLSSDESILDVFLKHVMASGGTPDATKIKVKRGDKKKNSSSNRTGDIVGLVMSKAKLSGQLFATLALPRALVRLEVEGNALSGAFNFGLLPPELETLNLSYNNFSGSLSGHPLPPSLVSLKLHNNKFSGRIDLSHLPPYLKEAYLQENAFTSVGFSFCAPGSTSSMRSGGTGTPLALDNGTGTGGPECGEVVLDAAHFPPLLSVLNLSGNPFVHGKVALKGPRMTLSAFWA
jgi:hypothetical protein